MDIDNLINNIDSSDLSIAFGRIKNISSTTITASGLEVAVGDIVKIESVQHSSTVLGMVASINSEAFTIVPFSFIEGFRIYDKVYLQKEGLSVRDKMGDKYILPENALIKVMNASTDKDGTSYIKHDYQDPEEYLEKIVKTYKNKDVIKKYSHIAKFEEIKENDFNLNIPRYVDTFEEEAEIDIDAVQKEIDQLYPSIEENILE
jgi:flagellar biosynthesis/type III secretory pathway ATPase